MSSFRMKQVRKEGEVKEWALPTNQLLQPTSRLPAIAVGSVAGATELRRLMAKMQATV